MSASTSDIHSRPNAGRRFWAGWTIALGATLLLVVLATLPPFVGEEARTLIMRAFAPLCHQLPDYSPHVRGVQLGVGHRMYGIFGGLAFGTLAFLGLRRWDDVVDRHAALVLGVAAAPMVLDWTMNMTSWWTKTPVSRSATGLLFGVAAGYFLARALVNLLLSTASSKRAA